MTRFNFYGISPNLHFVGEDLYTINNHFSDIIQCFPDTKSVQLEKMLIGPIQAVLLRTLELKYILITRSRILDKCDIELGKAILKSKDTLITICIFSTINENHLYKDFTKTIDIIIKNLHLFKKLQHLSISLQMTPSNLIKLQIVKRMKKLRTLTIFENPRPEDFNDEILDIMIKKLIGDSNLIIHVIPPIYN